MLDVADMERISKNMICIYAGIVLEKLPHSLDLKNICKIKNNVKMTRDWLAAMLNDLVNCKKAGKNQTIAMPVSKLMLGVLKLMKEHGYIENFKVEEDKFKKVIIKIGKLNNCKAIKPRFFVNSKNIEHYIRRFLPARDIGILIVSTNKGLITHKEALEKKIGGSLIAFCY